MQPEKAGTIIIRVDVSVRWGFFVFFSFFFLTKVKLTTSDTF